LDKELALLRRIKYGQISSEELLSLSYEYANNYRVKFALLQHPSFPVRSALNIIPTLFTIDLVRLIKNRRTNPFIRKRAEVEFVNKYPRYPLGEKITYMKIAPLSLLNRFIREKDKRILKEMLNNAQCTEELVLKMINLEDEGKGKFEFYDVLSDTEWYKRRQVAEGIANDKSAPIKIILKVLPYLSVSDLNKMFKSVDTHQTIKRGITEYLNSRVNE
jgi:hypothetical protein